jgi:hypothetical protein
MDYDLGVWVLCNQAKRARLAGEAQEVSAGTQPDEECDVAAETFDEEYSVAAETPNEENDVETFDA